MSEFGDGLPAGARIEEFEIVRELGRGGFGITYLARDHALHRLVAVKEYYPVDWSMRQAGGSIGPRSTTMAADYAWGLEKFVAEARVLARLDHPGIVKVHRIVEAAGSAYMAMEHIDGHSLADELLNSGPLSAPRVHRLLQRLAEGLAEVHAAGLLHRDVKPANVMLRARDGSPVLIDFGAARQQNGPAVTIDNDDLDSGLCADRAVQQARTAGTVDGRLRAGSRGVRRAERPSTR